MSKKVQTNLKLDEELKKEAMKKAIDEGITLTEAVERLLAAWKEGMVRTADLPQVKAA